MAVLIGEARLSENNTTTGAPGDSTGREVWKRNYYVHSAGWNCVIRAKDKADAEKIASTMEAVCDNSCVGYSWTGETVYAKRTGLFYALKEAGWDAKKIKTKCNTDCSASTAACINAAGISVSKDCTTYNLRSACESTGKFTVLTDKKYLTGSDYLKRGDIVLNTVHHVFIVLSNGTKAEATSTTSGGSEMQKYQNGSTEEIVYSTTACNENVRIGSLDPYESCYCYGKMNGAYLVAYRINDTIWKSGFVRYAGGTSF